MIRNELARISLLLHEVPYLSRWPAVGIFERKKNTAFAEMVTFSLLLRIRVNWKLLPEGNEFKGTFPYAWSLREIIGALAEIFLFVKFC